MDNLFEFADELGPAKIIHIHEPTVGLQAILVVDNVARGPSIGGIRMAPDVSTEEAFRLARAMTFKNAAAGLPHGGGKSVIFGDPKTHPCKKEQIIRAFACAIRGITDYIPGPDMGTDEKCMAWIKDEIDRVVGLPTELGGIPLDEFGATGWGLFACVDVAKKFCDLDIKGARVVVQGFGAVGMHAARFLAQEGTILVAAADSKGTLFNPNGIDIDALMEVKKTGKSVVESRDGKRMERDAVVDIECDIWIPAARPDVINEDNVHRLKTRLIPQGANIPITPAAEKALHDRGILCIPDFIANAGGVICAAMEYRGATKAIAFDAIEEKIRRNTEQVLERAKSAPMLPRKAAEELAVRRIKKAMDHRRWGVF